MHMLRQIAYLRESDIALWLDDVARECYLIQGQNEPVIVSEAALWAMTDYLKTHVGTPFSVHVDEDGTIHEYTQQD